MDKIEPKTDESLGTKAIEVNLVLETEESRTCRRFERRCKRLQEKLEHFQAIVNEID